MSWWFKKKAQGASPPQTNATASPPPPSPHQGSGAAWWSQVSAPTVPAVSATASPAPSAPEAAAEASAPQRSLLGRLVGAVKRGGKKRRGTKTPPTGADMLTSDLLHIASTGEVMKIAVGQPDEDDLLRELLTRAIRSNASDIHIEPFDEHGGRIRLRVDGSMFPIRTAIPPRVFQQLSSRIKVMSDLDISNIRTPQDGRFLVLSLSLGRRIEFRVSVTPCLGGEKLVLRIVIPNPRFLDLDNLIVWQPVAAFVKQTIQTPSGLVLVTGPTGAGKTTTLYAALNAIEGWDHTLNIVTIEDPVEHNLKFAAQIQVQRDLNLDFSNILRTILRQDPDVILVGEIRDEESAAMALEAAMTGHLVFSSLHTYSALETLVRLHDLQVKPYLLASALKAVISQQLLPRLSPPSREPVPPDAPVVARLKELEVLEADWSGTLYRAKGGKGAGSSAEPGRIAVYEIMLITDRLRDLIDRSATRNELEQALDPRYFFSFARYCRFLLKQGLVSPEDAEQIFPKKPMSLPD